MTDPQVVATCYRHPGVATGVRCTRCNRPICPQCMIPAPVGFQCPECVQQGMAQTRQADVVRQANAAPVVSFTLIGLNAIIYLIQVVVGVDKVAGDWGMWPVGVAGNGEWWRLFTAAFLHGSWLHIIFNMYVLYALGPTLERILGHTRFLILYVMAALGGGVASYLFSSMNTLSVGASGAIFGLMGALVVAGKRLRYDITQVLALLAVNVVIGFISPGVDWRAHLGGLVVGAAVAAVFVYAPKQFRIPVQVLGILAILGVLVILTMWRTAQIMDVLAPTATLLT